MARCDPDHRDDLRRERRGTRHSDGVALALAAVIALAAATARAAQDDVGAAEQIHREAVRLAAAGQPGAAADSIDRALAGTDLAARHEIHLRICQGEFLRFGGRRRDALAALAAAAVLLDREGIHGSLRAAAEGITGQVWLDFGLLDLAARRFDREQELVDLLPKEARSRPVARIAAATHRANFCLAARDFTGLERLLAAAEAEGELFREQPGELAKLRLKHAIGLAEEERRDQGRPRAARALLEGLLAECDLGPGETARPELALVEVLVRERDFEAARVLLERAAARFDPSAPAAPAHFELWAALAAREALDRGAPEAELGALEPLLEAALGEFLARLAALDQRRGGYGHYLYADARAPLAEYARLELALRGPAAGAEAALRWLLRAQQRHALLPPIGAGAAVDLATVRAEWLRGDGAAGIIAYLPGPDRSFAFLVDVERATACELAGMDDLTAAGHALHADLAEPLVAAGAAERSRRLERAAELFLPEPARARMRRWSRLTVVGLDLVGALPFEALPFDGAAAGIRFAVAHLPSLPLGVALAAARALDPADGRRSRACLLAAPDFSGVVDPASGAPLAPLDAPPGAWGALLEGSPASRRRLFLGAAAAAPALASPDFAGSAQAEIVTHGVLDPDRERPVALALARSAANPDGLLFAEEIESLRAPPVVVLAACRSAYAPQRPGDGGAADLGGAFLAAGARAVLLSAVDLDLAAVLRMSADLHRELAAGATPAEALRDARAILAADPRFADPFYWCHLRAVGLAHASVQPAPLGTATALAAGGALLLAALGSLLTAPGRAARRRRPCRARGAG